MWTKEEIKGSNKQPSNRQWIESNKYHVSGYLSFLSTSSRPSISILGDWNRWRILAIISSLVFSVRLCIFTCTWWYSDSTFLSIRSLLFIRVKCCFIHSFTQKPNLKMFMHVYLLTIIDIRFYIWNVFVICMIKS